jgi:hypothetical protein
MVLMATSQPRIIDPSIATTRCRSDLANGLSDPEAVQRYLTTTASPGRTTRPVPSTTVVLDTPDDGGEEEDDESLVVFFFVVVVVLVDVAVVATSMPLVVDARSGRRPDGGTWEEEKASVVPTRERRQSAANNSGWTEGCTMVTTTSDDDDARCDAMGIKTWKVGGICGQAQKVKKLVLFSPLPLFCFTFFSFQHIMKKIEALQTIVDR